MMEALEAALKTWILLDDPGVAGCVKKVAETLDDLAEATDAELKRISSHAKVSRSPNRLFMMIDHRRKSRDGPAAAVSGNLRSELEASWFGGTTALARAVAAAGNRTAELVCCDEPLLDEFVFELEGIRLKPLQEARLKRWLNARRPAPALAPPKEIDEASPSSGDEVPPTEEEAASEEVEEARAEDGSREKELPAAAPAILFNAEFAFKMLPAQDLFLNNEPGFAKWFGARAKDLDRKTRVVTSPKFVVHGLGTIAIENIAKRTLIHDPTALVIDFKELAGLGLEGTDSYIFNSETCIMLRTHDRRLASRTYFMNEARNGAKPNIRWEFSYSDRRILGWRALRDVERGEELLVSYGVEDDDDDEDDEDDGASDPADDSSTVTPERRTSVTPNDDEGGRRANEAAVIEAKNRDDDESSTELEPVSAAVDSGGRAERPRPVDKPLTLAKPPGAPRAKKRPPPSGGEALRAPRYKKRRGIKLLETAEAPSRKRDDLESTTFVEEAFDRLVSTALKARSGLKRASFVSIADELGGWYRARVAKNPRAATVVFDEARAAVRRFASEAGKEAYRDIVPWIVNRILTACGGAIANPTLEMDEGKRWGNLLVDVLPPAVDALLARRDDCFADEAVKMKSLVESFRALYWSRALPLDACCRELFRRIDDEVVERRESNEGGTAAVRRSPVASRDSSSSSSSRKTHEFESSTFVANVVITDRDIKSASDNARRFGRSKTLSQFVVVAASESHMYPIVVVVARTAGARLDAVVELRNLLSDTRDAFVILVPDACEERFASACASYEVRVHKKEKLKREKLESFFIPTPAKAHDTMYDIECPRNSRFPGDVLNQRTTLAALLASLDGHAVRVDYSGLASPYP